MKAAPLLLAASLAANALLFGALAFQPALAPPAFRDFFTRHFHADDPVAEPAPAVVPPPPAEKIKLWAALETDDLGSLIARLRAAGFPPEIIRAVVQAEVNARYNARLRALQDPDPNTPFWKIPSSMVAFGATSKTREEINQLQRERTKLIRDLLADPFFATNDVTTAQRRQFGNLDRTKIDAAQRVEDDYAEMTSAIRAAMKGVTLPEDREKLALLEREKRADLAALLSPADLADYELRSSPITSLLRGQLNGFAPTEAEYRAIFQMQQALGEKNSSNGMPLGGGDYQQRQAALEQLETQLKTTLGEARYADYARETNYEYQQLKRIAQRENLPAETASRAFGLRESIAQQSNRIFDDTALTDDQKRSALQSLAQGTRTQLLATLGPIAGPAYLKIVDNQWLNPVERGAAVKFTGTSMSMSNGNAMVVFGGGPSLSNLPRPPP